jgi:hypothetical protein
MDDPGGGRARPLFAALAVRVKGEKHMSDMNPNCCGAHCRDSGAEVRVYPLGGGGNRILCRQCWAHENRYRFNRGREMSRPQDWLQQDWYAAEIYPS